MAVSSISIRSVSSRRRSLAVKSLWFEVMLVQRSLQPPSFAAVRVPSGDVAVALARHFEARFLQGGDDIGAAVDYAALDALDQVVPDQLARVGLEVPLCGRAAEILEAARTLGDGRSPFVFASQGGKPFSITRLPRLLQNLMIAAVPHRFRSSFRDWAAYLLQD